MLLDGPGRLAGIRWTGIAVEEEFETRGAHKAAAEHAEKRLPLGQEVALFSAILATLGAIVSFLGGHTQNDALYYKNEAVLMKARASDTWAYYQAEGLKRHIAEQSAALMPNKAVTYNADAARYAAHADALRRQAEAFDHKSEEADVESQHSLRPPIALASITVLTKKRWLMTAAAIFALLGVGLGILAWV